MLNDRIIKIEISDYFLYDKLNVLAVQYSTTVDRLSEIAIMRLVDDIEFVRQLRNDSSQIIPRQDGQT